MAPQRNPLPDGRMHFSHGPIDLVIQAEGDAEAIALAHAHAWCRFQSVLPELVAELVELRRRVVETTGLQGTVAKRMWKACHPFRADYITPMAAVAGSVAQEIITCYAKPGIRRAAVNNGGDIALHLEPGQSYRIGICADVESATVAALGGALSPDGEIGIDAAMPVRGIATSGWRGRSFSLGIADSVTVLAATAAKADAAATVIANAVNVHDARIRRVAACELKDDCDLGDLPVTVDVPLLEPDLVGRALRNGRERASELRERGLLWNAVLICQGQVTSLDAQAHQPDLPVQQYRDALRHVVQARHAELLR